MYPELMKIKEPKRLAFTLEFGAHCLISWICFSSQIEILRRYWNAKWNLLVGFSINKGQIPFANQQTLPLSINA